MHTITEDLRPIHAAAVRATVALVARATPADLAQPTPCAGWDLAALLAHMTAQHHGFAAAARGHGADVSFWTPEPIGADFADRYADAVTTVLDAFAEPDVLDRPFVLPEFSTDRTFPGRLALTFHLVDYVVHGWDVARSLGLPYRPEPEILAATLPIARAVPDDASRLAPGAAFAPARPVPPGSGPLAEILLLLGRCP
ncbi:TIGR03086 family protein [Actinoplanes ianthinogenes]|uniref:TIGR03086 family protein n=1 Tax=Actinoplanes ianthinogenes TaxID=122358 RepID=A0ABM7LS34_9ACTN|nr:TIGR03086 family metal-binding protein [Actinoplanes ianthinogenes]BCJ42054.1 TIGR03086 family protein [Actinoplanes ianthinogenes]GGR37970.1 TIGR03086 family protein [Actinoplanes ianthinogenes]